MRTTEVQIVLLRRADDQLTLEELAASAGLHPELVERFVEFGLLCPLPLPPPRRLFALSSVDRLRAIVRLRRDVGVNLTGVAVILDLLDRIRELQRELERRDLEP